MGEGRDRGGGGGSGDGGTDVDVDVDADADDTDIDDDVSADADADVDADADDFDADAGTLDVGCMGNSAVEVVGPRPPDRGGPVAIPISKSPRRAKKQCAASLHGSSRSTKSCKRPPSGPGVTNGGRDEEGVVENDDSAKTFALEPNIKAVEKTRSSIAFSSTT